MQYKTLEYKVEEKILTLSLNRPEQMNAFTVEMAGELVHAFNRASDDDDVSVIVVTGKGGAFCAGMDLTREGNVFGLDESQQPTLEDMQNTFNIPGVSDTGGMVNLSIYECKKPVIAAINGAAVGVGATMLAAMDIRLASQKARIGFVFEKIGITPEACSSWFLPRIVGLSQALEWVYTGDIIDADTAKEAGFVRSVHAPEDLLEAAYELARKITGKSQVAITLARQMMLRLSAAPSPRDAHNVDSLAIFYTSQVDGKEGVKSFLEKRDPEFTSKSSTDMPSFYPWWK
ncbi:MAG: enoyl-CoA hydratase [unclassified Hahellaceae]|nr:enoyl-CoA hydratase [Hahellaceae bacterium]|tara:strand:+ start:28978 stop:29841 length:864 start_codon:yes stop_codon:yes gene_type:complete